MSTAAPVYRWRCAPRHLRTRRQLRAAGLSPGGQDIAGRLPYRRYGRVYTAYLYDQRRAVPVRAATPAQLAALSRANHDRQLRAAERRGITVADLHTDTDPGPQWAEVA